MKVSLKKEKHMVMGFIFMKMEQNMKVIGNMIKRMDMEKKSGLMVVCLKVIS